MVTGKVSPLAVSKSIEISEEIAETEVKSNEDAIIEESDEEDPVEENDEEISDEEIFDEEDEEEDNEEEENNNENQIEEIIIEEKKEETNSDENDIKEVTEEKKEEEDNNDNETIQEELSEEKKIDTAIDVELSNEKKEEENKEEGKTELVSKIPAKKSKKRIRKKKNDNKDKPKPEPSVKTPPAKKAKTSAAAKDGKEEGPTSVTKDEKEGKKGKKGKNKPETPGKKVESMGMIFMCSSKTKKDCYQYNVFGLPAGKKETVQKIYKGMRLFLYDIDLKLMYGIYKASAPGGFNLEPKAFNSAYPSQVRFTVMEDCEPLGEEKFKTVIKENYYSKNKFNPQLNSDQVKNLCKLFAFANKSSTPKSKKPARNSKSAPVQPRQPSGRGRKILKRVQDEPNRPPRSPRRFTRRNLDYRPIDRHPVSRYPVDYRLDDRRVVYEREAFVQPPPAVVPPLSYSYETEAYRRDLPPLENRGRSYLDYEQTSRDRYYYREREPIPYTREYGYDPASASAAGEYNYLPAPVLPPPHYSYSDPATSDYRSTEGMRADYRIPAAAEGRYSDYRSSARDRMYRL